MERFVIVPSSRLDPVLTGSLSTQLFFNQYSEPNCSLSSALHELTAPLRAVNPIGFDTLGYSYYYPYIGVICVNLVIVWFLFPETAGLTRASSCLPPRSTFSN